MQCTANTVSYWGFLAVGGLRGLRGHASLFSKVNFSSFYGSTQTYTSWLQTADCCCRSTLTKEGKSGLERLGIHAPPPILHLRFDPLSSQSHHHPVLPTYLHSIHPQSIQPSPCLQHTGLPASAGLRGSSDACEATSASPPVDLQHASDEVAL